MKFNIFAGGGGGGSCSRFHGIDLNAFVKTLVGNYLFLILLLSNKLCWSYIHIYSVFLDETDILT